MRHRRFFHENNDAGNARFSHDFDLLEIFRRRIVSRGLRLHDGDSPLAVIFALRFKLPVRSVMITSSQGSALSYAAGLWRLLGISEKYSLAIPGVHSFRKLREREREFSRSKLYNIYEIYIAQ